MNKTTNILFCGTGGQGVLTAAELCGWAAMLAGYHVKKSEVHGMAQRGGSVESHLRFGQEVFSPLIPLGQADILVPFHQEEEQRLKSFLKKDGLSLLSFLEKAKNLPDKKFINTYLIGVLSAKINIPVDFWHQALEKVYAGKQLDKNIFYFEQGRGSAR